MKVVYLLIILGGISAYLFAMNQNQNQAQVAITLTKSSYAPNEPVLFTIKNQSDQAMAIAAAPYNHLRVRQNGVPIDASVWYKITGPGVDAALDWTQLNTADEAAAAISKREYSMAPIKVDAGGKLEVEWDGLAFPSPLPELIKNNNYRFKIRVPYSTVTPANAWAESAEFTVSYAPPPATALSTGEQELVGVFSRGQPLLWGIRVEFYPDRRFEYRRFDDMEKVNLTGTWRLENSDVVLDFPSGSERWLFEDGRLYYYYPNGQLDKSSFLSRETETVADEQIDQWGEALVAWANIHQFAISINGQKVVNVTPTPTYGFFYWGIMMPDGKRTNHEQVHQNLKTAVEKSNCDRQTLTTIFAHLPEKPGDLITELACLGTITLSPNNDFPGMD